MLQQNKSIDINYCIHIPYTSPHTSTPVRKYKKDDVQCSVAGGFTIYVMVLPLGAQSNHKHMRSNLYFYSCWNSQRKSTCMSHDFCSPVWYGVWMLNFIFVSSLDRSHKEEENIMTLTSAAQAISSQYIYIYRYIYIYIYIYIYGHSPGICLNLSLRNSAFCTATITSSLGAS